MLFREWIKAWRKRHTFKIELALALSLKILLLIVIWYFFFSSPLQDHLNDQLMGQHFISQSASH